ncbi:Uncharacterized protein PBTT_02625 [Plasmodiophora brassicae]
MMPRLCDVRRAVDLVGRLERAADQLERALSSLQASTCGSLATTLPDERQRAAAVVIQRAFRRWAASVDRDDADYERAVASQDYQTATERVVRDAAGRSSYSVDPAPAERRHLPRSVYDLLVELQSWHDDHGSPFDDKDGTGGRLDTATTTSGTLLLSPGDDDDDDDDDPSSRKVRPSTQGAPPDTCVVVPST